ncbi:hypothetical protein Q4603_18520 [Zobellia galactanivorans]|uniref:hypothetical protein n=1 Tax=Zobellia galactanivorans (strain DSM 12802 / CCUG 47099 / CIP 106680 / NCIMB 13871 / Dsij) TaxID=63186 RepID=UPI0026E45552|nr:hypothetical protein [Zobellia galactanivorans]MDO6810624.1 hypothetical protein [Zobellia galactanivorans]
MALRNDRSNKDCNLEISLNRIEHIFQDHERQTIIKDLELLIKQDDWRPQLIFCISILKLHREDLPNLKKELCHKLNEQRSWVIPQLAATVSILDSNFKSMAIDILKKQKRIDHVDRLSSDHVFIELSRGNTPFEDKGKIAIRWKERVLQPLQDEKI